MDKLSQYEELLKETKYYQMLKSGVDKHRDLLRILTFKSVEEITTECEKIQDATKIDFALVRNMDGRDLFGNLAAGKFGEGNYQHIPNDGQDRFNVPPLDEYGLVSPDDNNSPEQVCYMANLFTHFFSNSIENPDGDNKLFAVGGIFPSFLLHQTLKDFDFGVVTKLENFRFLMRYMVLYFIVYVKVAQNIGKLPAGKITFKEDSPPTDLDVADHKNETPLNFNVSINRVDGKEFEGLDMVLLRTSHEGNEQNIVKPYGDEGVMTELYKNISTDAKRRETYLNIMYGEMKVDESDGDTIDTVIEVSDYFFKQPDDKFRDEYIRAFNNWEHIPTDGINTFKDGNGAYRINRIVKMYLKKYFKPDASLAILQTNRNDIVRRLSEIDIDILHDNSNGFNNTVFKLIKSKSELLKTNPLFMGGLVNILSSLHMILGFEQDYTMKYHELHTMVIREERVGRLVNKYIDGPCRDVNQYIVALILCYVLPDKFNTLDIYKLMQEFYNMYSKYEKLRKIYKNGKMKQIIALPLKYTDRKDIKQKYCGYNLNVLLLIDSLNDICDYYGPQDIGGEIKTIRDRIIGDIERNDKVVDFYPVGAKEISGDELIPIYEQAKIEGCQLNKTHKGIRHIGDVLFKNHITILRGLPDKYKDDSNINELVQAFDLANRNSRGKTKKKEKNKKKVTQVNNAAAAAAPNNTAAGGGVTFKKSKGKKKSERKTKSIRKRNLRRTKRRNKTKSKLIH